jgi:hypothetical protein
MDYNSGHAYFRSYTWFEVQAMQYHGCFVHADVKEDQDIYMEMLFDFTKQGKVLKLKLTLYGL